MGVRAYGRLPVVGAALFVALSGCSSSGDDDGSSQQPNDASKVSDTEVTAESGGDSMIAEGSADLDARRDSSADAMSIEDVSSGIDASLEASRDVAMLDVFASDGSPADGPRGPDAPEVGSADCAVVLCLPPPSP
jgi:hypothetical protein